MEVRYENGSSSNGWMFNLGTLGRVREAAASAGFIVPRVEVLEDNDKYYFCYEMPGLSHDLIDARIEDGQLLVGADRKRPEWPQETIIHVAECGYGKSHRAFELPKDASHDKIEASYKDGMLRVTVEKTPESKPAKILIN